MRKLKLAFYIIAFAVIAFLFCGCEERRNEDYILIIVNSKSNEYAKKVSIPLPLAYDRHEYDITTTGAVVKVYFTLDRNRTFQ